MAQTRVNGSAGEGDEDRMREERRTEWYGGASRFELELEVSGADEEVQNRQDAHE